MWKFTAFYTNLYLSTTHIYNIYTYIHIKKKSTAKHFSIHCYNYVYGKQIEDIHKHYHNI